MGKSKPLILILLVFLLFVSALIVNRWRAGGSLISPGNLVAENRAAPPLQRVVESAMAGANGTYSIVIKNMTTGEEYLQNSKKIYEPGSLYKLWVMGAVFEKISGGKIEEEEILSRDIAFLNREFGIAKEDAEFTSGVVTLSVKNALNQMIVISHNYAALLLLEKIKTSSLREFIKQTSLVNSDTGIPPKTTASDIALFFEKLYKKELVGLEYSERMLDLLKKQQLNDGLPKYLPENIVAHKTGDIGWFKHDGGIVFTKSGDYIIVILSESNSPSGAQERIALLSKAVYEYFTKK